MRVDSPASSPTPPSLRLIDSSTLESITSESSPVIRTSPGWWNPGRHAGSRVRCPMACRFDCAACGASVAPPAELQRAAILQAGVDSCPRHSAQRGGLLTSVGSCPTQGWLTTPPSAAPSPRLRTCSALHVFSNGVDSGRCYRRNTPRSGEVLAISAVSYAAQAGSMPAAATHWNTAAWRNRQTHWV